MENFNKNWLVILLVVFGTLGFLVGRTTGPHRHRAMRMMHEDAKEQLDIKVDVNDLEGTEVKTDTITKDGKQIIIKEVKKIKKN
jgi:hypothetical protein